MRQLLKVVPLSLLILASAILSDAQVNVTTYHNDNARTGQNTQEVSITPANVGPSAFEELFAVAVNGQVYAQPLFLSNVSIGGSTHDIVYVATEHDSVYAIDAGNGTVYWQKSFLGSGATTVSDSDINNCPNISPEIGVTGTPAIDTTSGTLYVVAKTKESGTFVQRLHALSVSTGAEKVGWPVVISATGFDAQHQLNRPGLLLENGHVVIAFGSHCDWTPYEGWVMSYNAATRAQEAAFNTVPSGSQGAVWMSGGGVASDANGNLYFATGNGTYGPNYTSPVDYGDSIVKLAPPSGGTFAVADWFTPRDQDDLNASGADTDLGSGGVLLLPDQPSGYTHTQLLVQMGKEGALYLVDRNGMGHYCSGCSDDNDTNIVQEIPNATVGVWGSPAYWNGRVYFGSADDHGHSDHVKAFSLYTTTPLLELTSQTPESFAYSTPTPSVSSNGTSNGILWVLDSGSWQSGCCVVLHAYDATNLATELYNSAMRPPRDEVGGAVKFAVPTVANGRVFVGTSGQLVAYGLLSSVTVQRPTTDAGWGVTCYPSGATVPSPTSIPYAYDGAGDGTSSEIDTTSGNGPGNTPMCFGRRISGWPAAAGSFTRLRLVLDFSCGINGSNTGCAAFYSTDSGSTWNLMYETNNDTNLISAVAVLPASQDLTKVQVGVSASGEIHTCCNYRQFASFWINDVRTEGIK